MKTTTKRKIQTEVSRDGYLIFRLVLGARKLKTIRVFGYSIQHKHWVQIFGLDTASKTIMHESAFDAKAQIAAWAKH